jgi:alpha-L-fucosidase
MKTQVLGAWLVLGTIGTAYGATPEINKTRLPDEVRAKQVQDMKWGMFICWSFSSFSGREWTSTSDEDASYFKTTGCDTDQWCQTAKDAGMGYILFLAKHHDGFCLWDTKTTDKKVTNSPLGIDVLAKLRKSCDKYGIKLALYFSEGDWNWPGAVDGKGRKGGTNPEVKKAQLKELLTNYGPIEFWWMDHAVGTGGLSHAETVKWMHKCQPNTFVGFNHGAPAGRRRGGGPHARQYAPAASAQVMIIFPRGLSRPPGRRGAVGGPREGANVPGPGGCPLGRNLKC